VYKLLIVEDERWEREGLIHFLNWTELGIEIAGTAANGQQGLHLAREHHPDIILTDIKMPKMDGLKLSEAVLDFLPQCRIIIITGYDDFAYAKDAIQFNVCEYLLKPIQKKPLLDAITRTIQGISQANKHAGYVRQLKAQAAEQAYAEREQYLLSLLSNTSYRGVQVNEFYKPAWHGDGMAAVVLKYDLTAYCIQQGLYGTQLRLREIFKRFCRTVGSLGIVAQDDDGQYEIIVCMPKGSSDRANIHEMIRRINQTENGQDVHKWAAGVGTFVKSAAEFAQSYREAKTALDMAFFMRDSNVVFYEDATSNEDMDVHMLRDFIIGAADYSKKIMNAVVTADPQGIHRIASSLFDYIYHGNVDRSFVCNYFLSLLNELSVLVLSVDGSASPIHRLHEDRPLDRFITLEDLKKWFIDLLVQVSVSNSTVRENREKLIADQVMDAIIDLYPTDLGVAVIASKLGFSPSYLGSLFKQQTGRGFSETLTAYRVKKAEELLMTQTDSIMDIAKTVGFASASYFNTVFKKIHGVTPMEYRNTRFVKNEDAEND